MAGVAMNKDAPPLSQRQQLQQDSIALTVQLVLPDPGTRRLRQSRRHATLHIFTTRQEAVLKYPARSSALFRRLLVQPQRAVLHDQLIKLYARNGRSAVLCRIPIESDVARCSEALRLIGVDVVDMNPGQFAVTAPPTPSPDTSTCNAQFAELSTAFRDPQRTSTIASYISEYSQSTQIQEDVAIISDALFATK